MTTALEAFVALLAERGVTLRLADDKVMVTGARHLTAEDREYLRDHRDELLELLTPPEPTDREPSSKSTKVVEGQGDPQQSNAARRRFLPQEYEQLRLERLRWARALVAAQDRGPTVADHFVANTPTAEPSPSRFADPLGRRYR